MNRLVQLGIHPATTIQNKKTTQRPKRKRFFRQNTKRIIPTPSEVEESPAKLSNNPEDALLNGPDDSNSMKDFFEMDRMIDDRLGTQNLPHWWNGFQG